MRRDRRKIVAESQCAGRRAVAQPQRLRSDHRARRQRRRRRNAILRHAPAARLPARRRRQRRRRPASASRTLRDELIARSARTSTATSAPICAPSRPNRRRARRAAARLHRAATSPTPNGKITLTIDYPDSLPMFSYAQNEDLRKRMFMEYNNRAYPKNIDGLDKMIARARGARASCSASRNWADYITADKMVGSGGQRIAVHRPHRRRVGSESRARVRRAARTQAAGRAAAPPSSTPGSARTTPSWCARRLRLRFAVGAAVLPVRSREAGPARRHRAGCSASPIGRSRTRRSGTRQSKPTRCSTTASWSGRFYLDMHPAAEQVQPRRAVRHPHRHRPAVRSRRRRWSAICPAASRRSRADDARRRA